MTLNEGMPDRPFNWTDRPLRRPRYFPGQLVTASDLMAAQTYVRQWLGRHNHFLHGCGVVCGLEVVLAPEQLTVTAGSALGPDGEAITVPKNAEVLLDFALDEAGNRIPLAELLQGDLKTGDISMEEPLYVAVRYREVNGENSSDVTLERQRPGVRVDVGAGTETSACRQAGFELALLTYRPATCPPSQQACPDLLDDLFQEERPPVGRPAGTELFACPPTAEELWVLLAMLSLDADGLLSVDNSVRTRFLPIQSTQQLATCLARARPTAARFQVYIDRAGEYRWRLLADGDEIIADSGEGYATRAELDRDLLRVRGEALVAALEDLTTVADSAVVAERLAATADSGRSDTRFQVYIDRAGEYRWRFLVGNVEIMADSGEGYATRGELERDLARVRQGAAGGAIEDLT